MVEYADPRRITEWLNGEQMIATQYGGSNSKYGKVTNHEWLQKEMERINKTDKKCHIEKHGKLESLFYDDKYFSFATGDWVKIPK